jgi:predicted dehydrogenase
VWHARVHFRAGSRADAGRAWDWWSDAGQGGGVLGAIGSHAVDSLHWLTGARATQVSCTLATHVSALRAGEAGQLKHVTTDDEATLLLRLGGGAAAAGATAAVSTSVVESGEPMHVTEVFGPRGGLRTDTTGALFRADAAGREWRRVEVDLAPLAPGMNDNEWSRGFTEFSRRIVDALRGEGQQARVPDAATFDDGYHIQRVLDAARGSHESGCRVTVAD